MRGQELMVGARTPVSVPGPAHELAAVLDEGADALPGLDEPLGPQRREGLTNRVGFQNSVRVADQR